MHRTARKFWAGAASVFIILLLLIELYPVIWLFLSSLKTEPEFAKPMYALPEGLHLHNYTRAIQMADMGTLMQNTVFVTLTSILFAVLVSAPCSFALTKMRWRLADPARFYLRLGMFIPAFVMLLPLFLMFQQMKILNTLTVLVVVFSSGIALPIFLLNGFYSYVPDEIMEAAVIDGCGIYRLFLRIVVPMTSNGFVTVIMLTFFGIWNDLLISQTFVSSQKMKMLQVGLATFVGERGKREWGPTFAAICIAFIPTLVLYITLNKNIIKGLSEGAVKG